MLLYLYDLVKMLMACILGGLIGYQRQKKGMSMGLRTHIIVCVSAALVQIIAIDYNILNKNNSDVMRLGAQVISGIGFLGMASIIKEGGNIVGLTTAASVWFVACVGLAAGSGIYIPAIISTLIVYFILRDVFKFDKRIKKTKGNDNVYELSIVLDGDFDSNYKINNIINTIIKESFKVCEIHVDRDNIKNIKLFITVSLPSANEPNNILTTLLKEEYIKKVSLL